MRAVVVVLVALAVSSCNDGGSRTPTAPSQTSVVSTSPPAAPAPAPPAAPSITNYAGRWTGEYVVAECSGSSGSMSDILCSAPRGSTPGGIFQRGFRYPITIELSQSGSAVNGAISLGSMRGSVSGSVINSRLILSGTITYSDASVGLTVTNVITSWDTSIVSDQLVGDFILSIRVNVLPGDGTVRLRLQNTMRR